MIVLAITGALLIAAMVVISGRQAATQFSQSIQQIQAQMQQTMNDISNGFYQNDGNISCTTGGPGGGPNLTSAAQDAGTNSGCIFLGKVVQFSVGSEAGQYNTYTIAGLKGDVLAPVTTLAAAKPRLIARSSADPVSVPDVFEQNTMQYGLTVVNMYYGANPASNHIGALAFIASMSGLNAANNTQGVDVAALPGTNLGMSKETLVDTVNPELDTLPAAVINPSGGVHLCLKSAGTNQSALMTIGGQGGQANVNLEVKQNGNCS